MRSRPGRKFWVCGLIGVLLLLAVVGVLTLGRGGKAEIPRATRAALLRWALGNAKSGGVAHPRDIEVVRTGYLRAEQLLGGDLSSGQSDDAEVYLLAMRGQSVGYNAIIPARAPFPRGTVTAAIFTRSLTATDGYLGNSYPHMAAVGHPVLLR